jgi:serine/threonine protein kinase
MSPTYESREYLIEELQKKVPGQKLSDLLRKFLKKNRDFYSRLHYVKNWSVSEAKEFIKDANAVLKTITMLIVHDTYGYDLGEPVSYTCQSGTVVHRITNHEGYFCAKIGRPAVIRNEFEIGNKIKGPCIMPIHKFLSLSEEKAAIVTPLYQETIGNRLRSLTKYANEDEIISIILCGISAIYSFTIRGFAHCDIKLTNIMFVSTVKFILIDFGSATKFGETITSTTPGIGFNYSEPSTRYDINSLSVVIARFMLRNDATFYSKDHLFESIKGLSTLYPVVYEMLQLMRIDEDFKSAAELFQVWKNVYQVAKEKKPFVSKYPYFDPESDSP